MKSTLSIISILSFFIVSNDVIADSPLTSTPISQAYQNESIIVKAGKAKGKLTRELIGYLLNESNPIDFKIALINKLGWNFRGKTNSKRFMEYLTKNKIYLSEEDFFNNGKGDELLCMGYLKAMDNYFQVDDALKYAETALLQKPKSYTYQIITALIRAQKASGIDSCKVYKSTDEIRKNNSLTKDMKDDAISLIFEYMDIYKDSCTNQQ